MSSASKRTAQKRNNHLPPDVHKYVGALPNNHPHRPTLGLPCQRLARRTPTHLCTRSLVPRPGTGYRLCLPRSPRHYDRNHLSSHILPGLQLAFTTPFLANLPACKLGNLLCLNLRARTYFATPACLLCRRPPRTDNCRSLITKRSTIETRGNTAGLGNRSAYVGRNAL